MFFDRTIRRLSRELASCEDDAQALQLAHELQTVLREQIEQIRQRMANFSLLRRGGHELTVTSSRGGGRDSLRAFD